VQWSTAVVVTAPHVDGFCQLSAVTISQEFAIFDISVVLTVNIVNENQTIDNSIMQSIRRAGRSQQSTYCLSVNSYIVCTKLQYFNPHYYYCNWMQCKACQVAHQLISFASC